jgi:hypothetical protein
MRIARRLSPREGPSVRGRTGQVLVSSPPSFLAAAAAQVFTVAPRSVAFKAPGLPDVAGPFPTPLDADWIWFTQLELTA